MKQKQHKADTGLAACPSFSVWVHVCVETALACCLNRK